MRERTVRMSRSPYSFSRTWLSQKVGPAL
ncbi:hypothetical protein CGCSCA5_v015049 [Colletotrichum siamense]|nr:hypothetical protein CGCSCA5_v015049 [Colletotrichum siamense]KAF4860293.1 hypothetical protein CGCSCA1_v015095 [Colletotrichum siamense]